MRTQTPDQAALDILLRHRGPARDLRLAALRDRVRRVLDDRMGCPECGSEGPHQDNQCKGDEFALCCTSCGMQWYPENVDVSDLI